LFGSPINKNDIRYKNDRQPHAIVALLSNNFNHEKRHSGKPLFSYRLHYLFTKIVQKMKSASIIQKN